MSDFKFINIPSLDTSVILATKRSDRPEIETKKEKNEHHCPFCPATQSHDVETYRIGGETNDKNWALRVVRNKYPFADIHDVIIHSPKHVKSISELSLEEVRLVVETYVNRYNAYQKEGTVVIFSNSGHAAGESISHSHSQVVVVPKDKSIEVEELEDYLDYKREHLIVKDFGIICPPYSQWPDETWIVPEDRGKLFGEITYPEMESLAYVLRRLIYIFEARHGKDFPYNFYIYPHRDWYLRIIPRAKILGGFELATGIFVNTQDPVDTMDFIKKHFFEEDDEVIKKHKAEYRIGV